MWGISKRIGGKGCSVMASFHASIADVLDGSSFEIWVVSPNRVLIVPQAKSSVAAFMRLISHIFSEFGEGNIAEYGHKQGRVGSRETIDASAG